MVDHAWFCRDGEDGLSGVIRASGVHVFIDAEQYYSDLRRCVEQTSPGDQICWIGFDGAAHTPMPAAPADATQKSFRREAQSTDVSWENLLRAADDRGVRTRVLLNVNPSPREELHKSHCWKNTLRLVEALNKDLNHCGAIADFRYLWLNGTHHQKLVVIHTAGSITAYCGTCDIETARIQDQWCEIQCRFSGEAAAELYRVFSSRWIEHTDALGRLDAGRPDGSRGSRCWLKPVSISADAQPDGRLLMQVATTYGDPIRANPLLGLGVTGLNVWGAPLRQVVNRAHRLEISFGHLMPGLGFTIPSEIRIGKRTLAPARWLDSQLKRLIAVMPVTLPSAKRIKWIAHLLGSQTVRICNDFFAGEDPAFSARLEDAAGQSPRYHFAERGHTGIYRQIRHAIENTREFMYVEDQYLVCDKFMGALEPISDALARKLQSPDFKKLIIFCTRIDEINEELLLTGWRISQALP